MYPNIFVFGDFVKILNINNIEEHFYPEHEHYYNQDYNELLTFLYQYKKSKIIAINFHTCSTDIITNILEHLSFDNIFGN